jgi:hypothetical protein
LTQDLKKELSYLKNIQLIQALTLCQLIKKVIMLWDRRADKLDYIIKLDQMQIANIQALAIKFCIWKAQKMENGYWLLSLNFSFYFQHKHKINKVNIKKRYPSRSV